MGYNGLSRPTLSLPLKQLQTLEKACLPINYSPKLGAKQVLRTQSQNEVPRAVRRTHFYMECDVTLIVYVGTSWAQWRESL